jgi:hypothetical protein
MVGGSALGSEKPPGYVSPAQAVEGDDHPWGGEDGDEGDSGDDKSYVGGFATSTTSGNFLLDIIIARFFYQTEPSTLLVEHRLRIKEEKRFVKYRSSHNSKYTDF